MAAVWVPRRRAAPAGRQACRRGRQTGRRGRHAGRHDRHTYRQAHIQIRGAERQAHIQAGRLSGRRSACPAALPAAVEAAGRGANLRGCSAPEATPALSAPPGAAAGSADWERGTGRDSGVWGIGVGVTVRCRVVEDARGRGSSRS